MTSGMGCIVLLARAPGGPAKFLTKLLGVLRRILSFRPMVWLLGQIGNGAKKVNNRLRGG
jgi:hypothetical protein